MGVGDERGVGELATRKYAWEVVKEDGREGHLQSAGRALAAVHQPGHSFACAQSAVHSVFHLQSDSAPRPMRISPTPSFALDGYSDASLEGIPFLSFSMPTQHQLVWTCSNRKNGENPSM